MRRSSAVVPALALVLTPAVLLAACGGNGDDDATTSTTATAEPSADQAVDPAASAQLEWFVGVLGGAAVGEEQYAERFAASFRETVPFADFVQLTTQLRPAGPYQLEEVEPDDGDDGRGLVALAAGAGGERIRISLHVGADDLVDGLLVEPAELPELDDPPTTVKDAYDRLAELGEARLVAATVDGTDCTVSVDRGADEQAPIGSAFKLYVLGAVADAVTAGELAWDQPLTITADLKSLPSGILQDRPDGSTVPVQEAAGLMIAISDNTATDLLMAAVGREAVEEAQARYGHSAPPRNIPMMNTRELFALKAADADVRDRWREGDTTERRAVLAELADVAAADIPLTLFDDGPIAPDTIEWFASPLDLCRALATLLERAEEPGLQPVREILTANPGVPADDGRWSAIAFKGGSEPGMVAGAWLVESADGARRALAASVVDPDSAFDDMEAVLLLAAARDVLPVN